MRSNLATDPDVIDIASRIGADEFSVVGRLHALWAWADQHSCDGVLPRATSAFVDRLTACPGFAEALRQVGWLDGRDSALRLPNWDRHNGNTAKTRSLETRKKQRQRDKCPDGSPAPPGTPAGPEKRREDSSTPTPPEGADDTPDSPPGTAPTVEQFIAACARHSMPEWYARKRWQIFETKAWRSGQTPIVWKKLLPLIKSDFVNDGSPMKETKSHGPHPQPTPGRNLGHNAGVSYAHRPARPPTPPDET